MRSDGYHSRGSLLARLWLRSDVIAFVKVMLGTVVMPAMHSRIITAGDATDA